jgi:hypothetical protein
LYTQIPKIQALEGMDLSAAFHSDPKALRKHCEKILDDRTIEQIRDEQREQWERAAKALDRQQKRKKDAGN